MTNLTGKAPLGLKEKKSKADKRHLDFIRQQPCIVCSTFGEPQYSATQAHHCIHDRFSQAKRPDKEAIPLCEGHHQGMMDTSKVAIHREPARWRDLYGPDWGFIQLMET